MKLGTVKSYILHEEEVGDLNLKIMRSDSSGFLIFQVDKDNKTIIRKKIKDEEQGKDFINKIKGNRVVKKARMYSDNPKAFDERIRPSDNDGGGGFLQHLKSADEIKNNGKFNKKRLRPFKDYEFEHTDGEESTVGKSYKTIFDPKRDDEEDRNQDNLEGKGESQEGSRPPIPKEEDPIEVAKKPQEYKVNYNAGYPVDRVTTQDIEESYGEQLRKKELKLNEERRTSDLYRVRLPDGSVKSVPYNKAVELNRKKKKVK